MFEQVQRQEQSPVVVVATQAEADLLVATFQVHGLHGMTIMASAIPSLDWLEGFAVQVPAEEEQRARMLLRELGHEPLAPDEPGH
ncbi:MAG: hypothetical protein EA388_05480 [Nitriliruptor sp.]|nr:MAG: hypothetical protein EA388_05480 [Nitriliruptor sp.]